MDPQPRLLFGVCVGMLVLAAYASMHTPAATAPADTALVMGRVVDAASGAPVGGATIEMSVAPAHPRAAGGAGPTVTLNNVQLQGGVAFSTGSGSSARVLTDAGGQFAFRAVPAGRADFEVTATGYSGGAYHQLRPDGPGQALDIAEGSEEKPGQGGGYRRDGRLRTGVMSANAAYSRDLSRGQRWVHGSGQRGGRLREERHGLPVIGGGHHRLARVDPTGRQVVGCEGGGHDAAAGDFAHRRDGVEPARRHFAQHAQGADNALELGELCQRRNRGREAGTGATDV